MQMLSLATPLPLHWDPSKDPSRARRRRAGTIQLRDRALSRFNSVLSATDLAHRQLDADQIASAARNLFNLPHLPIPACIYDRLRATALLRRMARDRDWEPDPASADCVEHVLEYLADTDELIPHNAPVIGHFDDAILVEVAWPRVGNEASMYQDYRRLRRMEAELRGIDAARMGFNRDDWLNAREAEQRLMQRFRGQGLGSYRIAHGSVAFRVH